MRGLNISQDGTTALIMAAIEGRADIAEELLHFGADKEAKDKVSLSRSKNTVSFLNMTSEDCKLGWYDPSPRCYMLQQRERRGPTLDKNGEHRSQRHG